MHALLCYFMLLTACRGTFATGGCDKQVFMWDGANKKRLCALRKFPTSVASLSFNSTGELLAVASSYTYEEGDKEYGQPHHHHHHSPPVDTQPMPSSSTQCSQTSSSRATREACVWCSYAA
jgi:WD40 repeat protein